ncbi:MAG: ParB/RepB/Spo0J family partition protein [Ruminococcus sp.]|nr:ParB/RepB/Spo0J family partition protein [Ruminococcus sp.]
MTNHIEYISIEKLIPHPNNPRKDLGDLTELADSIKANGVYQNLTVVDNQDDTYTIIIGHRRHAAAKLAGIAELPCVIAQMTEKQQLETMLLENMQRTDLTIIEEAQGLQLLIDLGDSVANIAASTGFSKKKIKSRLLLNGYKTADVEKAFSRGATLEDYVKLDRIKNESKRKEVAKYLGSSNFDYYLSQAIDAEKWDKEKPKIIGVLEGFKAVDSAQHPISYSEYVKTCALNTAKEVYAFCEDNPDGREIRYRMSNYSNLVTVYLMKTEEEIKNSSNSRKGDDESARRAAIADYRKSLISRLEQYIDSFIAEHDDKALGLNSSSQLIAIDSIVRAIITIAIENNREYYQQTPLSALSYLGLGRNTIARDDKNDYHDVNYAICTDKPEGKKALGLGRNPVQFLLALLRAQSGLGICSEYYSYDRSYTCVKFRKTKHPALLIENLERHGFQTPDELRQYIDGTHPMYTEEGCKSIINSQFDQ